MYASSEKNMWNKNKNKNKNKKNVIDLINKITALIMMITIFCI